MMKNRTLEYYNQNAEEFISGSVNVDMSDIQTRFCEKLPRGGRILDLGCGSGRDSKYFMEQGYAVTAVDGSERICALTAAYLNLPVLCSTFQKFFSFVKFDGIWASASLLHAEKSELPGLLKKYAGLLNDSGCFYVSFKYGTFAGDRTGRYYTDLDEPAFHAILEQVPELRIDEEFCSADAVPGREEQRWLNVFLKKAH